MKRELLELSLRGILLGIAITVVFTAANVYLGLKVGLTFATSIPAAVISMAILSAFKNASILENNIVQTIASAAGTLAAIIFVLPGLVIVGWWTGFPFWTSFLICASGGVLGVLFTIPLRRAMVTNSDLPYPEGVAAAEVLEVGSRARNGGDEGASAQTREGLRAVIYGSVASLGLTVLSATRIAADGVTSFFRLGPGVSGLNTSFSLALFGAGYLVGLSVGMAMLLGVVIAWGGAVPILTAMNPAPGVAISDHAMQVWSEQVRFIGAGTIGVAAIWTLLRLAGPVVSGVASTLAASRRAKNGEADKRDIDLPASRIIGLTVICLAVIAFLVRDFIGGTVLSGGLTGLFATAMPFVLIGGFLVAAVCGYMAGLIGASNSPISGIGILAVVLGAALLVAVIQPTAEMRSALVAFSLFVTAIVFGIACISNDNLQDLKTGQLVGASPRAQQWALIIGVLAGAVVIPPVLNLLAQAYGFAGAPRPASAVAEPLPAPQASLIAALAQGVIEHDLNWTAILIGAGIGVVLVGLDEFLALRKWLRLPPLAVGIGIYLPMSVTLPVVFGAIVGRWYKGRAKKAKDPMYADRLGTLVASGMIVGESMFGVVLAGLIVATSKEAPLGLVGADFPFALIIGLGAYVALIAILFRWMLRRSKIG